MGPLIGVLYLSDRTREPSVCQAVSGCPSSILLLRNHDVYAVRPVSFPHLRFLAFYGKRMNSVGGDAFNVS